MALFGTAKPISTKATPTLQLSVPDSSTASAVMYVGIYVVTARHAVKLGRHALVDGRGVPADILDDKAFLEAVLERSCTLAGAVVLETTSHKFEPQGVTVVGLLAESHASIHTYPEHGCYMADVFTCGDVDPTQAAAVLAVTLGGQHKIVVMDRPV